MARNESDREDLMKDATGLVHRIEFSHPQFEEHVIVGFKQNQHCSFYFGQDVVFQFDDQNGLRRAHFGGSLYRTQATTLAKLTRERTEAETFLMRKDLSSDELHSFIKEMRERLEVFRRLLVSEELHIEQQIPDELQLKELVQDRLDHILKEDIVLAPTIAGKA